MPSVDFETMTRPISATNPCGPDLDAEGDIDFLNFFASVESVLPQSYFRARDPESGETRLFDPKMIAFDRYFEDAKPFVEKTSRHPPHGHAGETFDPQPRFERILACVKALAALLVLYWDEVHPKGEEGDFTYRGIALEALDVAPTVTMPLQFLPLVNDRRIGSVSYRNHLTATGAVPPAEGEPTLDLTAVERVLDTCELDILIDNHSKFQDILGATRQLREVWSEKNASGEALSFDQLATEAGAIAKWLGDTINRRSPGFGDDEAAPSTGDEEGGELTKTTSGIAPSGPIKSAAQAIVALNAVARYYAIVEPSSPARLLINLSEQMIGKTFTEIVRILAPNYVEQAAIKIGTNAVLDLPIVRMAEPLDGIARPRLVLATKKRNPNTWLAPEPKLLQLLTKYLHFFRMSEPSSPVPMLLERIRDLGQRDFLYLLRSVLPADALKPPE